MKTPEEKAREMYPDYEVETYLHNNVTRKIQREAFVKGYQRRCLEQQTEMGEYGCKQAEQEDLPNSWKPINENTNQNSYLGCSDVFPRRIETLLCQG